MDCVNHGGVTATAYCQNCGKALCAACARNLATGQILCQGCAPVWQSYQPPAAPPPMSGPNPSVAAALGVIPGVGAMYNGQFLKGLIHVGIFAVLVSLASHYDVFGLLIAAWFAYQIFEAYQTAKAMRYGLPVPDPLGLNQLADLINPNGRQPNYPPPAAEAQPGQGQAYTAGAAPYAPYTPPQPPPYYATDVPPPPPPPPACGPSSWCSGAPVGAIVLIVLGGLFLLGQLDIFHGRIFEFFWPVLLIGLGIWLIVRRVAESQGGPR